MIRLSLLTLTLAVASSGMLSGDIPPQRLREVDRLHDEDRHDEVLSILEELSSEAQGSAEEAALIWRRARARFSQVDLGLYSGELGESRGMEELKQIEALAAEAVELAADSGDASLRSRTHFWLGAAMAKQGELQGVLNALSMAGDLRESVRRSVRADEEYANPYYMAGQLYNQVPGFPVAFGDKAAAVSYSRLSVDLHEEQFDSGMVTTRYWDFYVKLATHLEDRGWSGRRRGRHRSSARREYESAADPFEAAAHYEGVAELPDLSERSDRQESQEILRFVIDGIEGQSRRTLRDRRALEEARGLLR
ncbi:MAG: hypothetical protein ACOC45_06700 [Alkalispirochaetaceae bacterium]